VFRIGAARDHHVTGQLAAGMAADFVVLDRDPLTGGADSLLTTNVKLTVVAGSERYPQQR
jgi:predicted amidohydrolase YtcJ